MIKKLITLVVIVVVLAGQVIGQDREFTQFFASPMLLNPALTGTFSGKYRLSAIYRDQWRGALDKPYTTFSAAVDLKFNAGKNSFKKDFIGIGIVFFTDKVNVLDFSTNQVSFSAAYHKALDAAEKHYLSAGIQAGIAQRNMNYEDLTFHDEFDGLNGYNLGTGERFPANNFSYTDLSTGINYQFQWGRNSHLFAGVGLHHFLEPNVSFYQEEDPPLESKLHQKISVQLSASLPLVEGIQLVPRVLFATQGNHRQIQAGSNIRLARSGFGDFALHFGAWIRTVKSIDKPFDFNSVVVFTGFEIDNFLLGLSYDVNLQDVINYQQGQNIFEISFSYLGEYENDTILCPQF